MEEVNKYFFRQWLVFFSAITTVIFFLIFLVFFAMLFLQVMSNTSITIWMTLGWVLLRSVIITHALFALFFLFSVIFSIFYFEQNGELKGLYLCGKNLYEAMHFLWFIAIAIITMQVILSQSAIPNWQTKNSELENKYLKSDQEFAQRSSFKQEQYLIEIGFFGFDRLELRALQIVAIDTQDSQWLWLEATRGYWEENGWRLEKVRALDGEKNWKTIDSLFIVDIIPNPTELWQKLSKKHWHISSSNQIKNLIKNIDFSIKQERQLRYIYWQRYTNWFSLLLLLLPIRWYDPSKKWPLLRLFFTFLLAFVLLQVMNIWSGIWMEYSGVIWYFNLFYPFIALGVFFFVLRIFEDKAYYNKREKNLFQFYWRG